MHTFVRAHIVKKRHQEDNVTSIPKISRQCIFYTLSRGERARNLHINSNLFILYERHELIPDFLLIKYMGNTASTCHAEMCEQQYLHSVCGFAQIQNRPTTPK